MGIAVLVYISAVTCLTPMPLHCPHRNHCAYVVQKNITCTMQDGVATYVKAEYTTKCIWGQKCPVVM